MSYCCYTAVSSWKQQHACSPSASSKSIDLGVITYQSLMVATATAATAAQRPHVGTSTLAESGAHVHRVAPAERWGRSRIPAAPATGAAAAAAAISAA